MNVYDVVVIGAGPVGLYTGYYCGLRKLNTIICDSLDTVGGQLSNQYPEKVIYDLPGFETITAGEFIQRLDAQISNVEDYVSKKLNFKVVDLINHGEHFEVKSETDAIFAKSVIVAMGNGSFEPRKMNLFGEDDYKNIHYYVEKKSNYKDKNVVVLGGGDSAIDWALMLEGVAKSVTLIHRRNEFRAKEGIVERLQKSNVNIMTPYIPSELNGDHDTVTSLFVSEVNTKDMVEIEVDEIIVSYGSLSTTNAIQSWGLDLEGKKIKINQQSTTNIPGIFACGDITYYEGREVQIISGLSEGMMASAAANLYVNEGKRNRPIR
ncbi:hypothetical protein AOC36_06325 [Erysipelothrix larvae]|uniref:Ferredoxin--NADP reductase n=1 Tax=Erysipelothrix larvae TaxID=1514105 RepID=A0A0X8H0G9_9FIRM|nr:NAD(P)/FAD-dependent oxidoreductase [Erysipelothrix larvae]AMC93614.1 hypothetical protein AOC36_06325 [Erysipelothrix larvae]